MQGLGRGGGGNQIIISIVSGQTDCLQKMHSIPAKVAIQEYFTTVFFLSKILY